jgi:hypothetical protein
LDDPLRQAKAKAAATYDAAVDHFDDEPLTFWDRIGRRTVERLALSLSAQVLDVVAAPAPRRCRRLRLSDQAGVSSVSICRPA